MSRSRPSHLLAVREYLHEVKDLPVGKCNDAPLLLKIVSNHDVHDRLAAVLEMLHQRGYFRPPKEFLQGYPSDKVKQGVFEYLRNHGNTPDRIGLAQIADFHGIRSSVLAKVLVSFKLKVPPKLPPMLRDEEENKSWRKKPR